MPFLLTTARAGLAGLGLVLAGAVSAQTPPVPAVPPAPLAPEAVVARVDGTPITGADVAVASDDPALQLTGTDEAQKRDIIVGYLVDLKLGVKAAEGAKLGDTPEFRRRLAYLRDKLLVDEYLDAETRKQVTPAAERKLYEETVKDMKPETEVRARHILVKTEDEAKKVVARLKAGEDFAKVAAETSEDPGSKTDGGELGFFAKDQMVGPFADAAFRMKVGETSGPVNSQFGWHVINVEETRAKPVPAFDDMKEQITQYLTRKAQQDAVMALRKSGKVERLDKPADAPKP